MKGNSPSCTRELSQHSTGSTRPHTLPKWLSSSWILCTERRPPKVVIHLPSAPEDIQTKLLDAAGDLQRESKLDLTRIANYTNPDGGTSLLLLVVKPGRPELKAVPLLLFQTMKRNWYLLNKSKKRKKWLLPRRGLQQSVKQEKTRGRHSRNLRIKATPHQLSNLLIGCLLRPLSRRIGSFVLVRVDLETFIHPGIRWGDLVLRNSPW